MTNSKKHENRLLIECRKLEKKIDNWLNVDWFRRTKKSIIDKSSFSQIYDHFRWFTMRIMKIKCNYRFQKKNFKSTIFFWFAYFYEWFDDFFLICVFLQMIWRFSFEHSRIFTSDKNFVSTRSFYEQSIFFNFAYLYEIDDFISFARVFRRAIYSKQRIWRMSINFAKLKARNLLCKRQWIIVIANWWKFRVENEIVTKLIEKFVLKMCNRYELNDFVFFIRWSFAITNVKFTLFVTMKIKYNVKRVSKNQIT